MLYFLNNQSAVVAKCYNVSGAELEKISEKEYMVHNLEYRSSTLLNDILYLYNNRNEQMGTFLIMELKNIDVTKTGLLAKEAILEKK